MGSPADFNAMHARPEEWRHQSCQHRRAAMGIRTSKGARDNLDKTANGGSRHTFKRGTKKMEPLLMQARSKREKDGGQKNKMAPDKTRECV